MRFPPTLRPAAAARLLTLTIALTLAGTGCSGGEEAGGASTRQAGQASGPAGATALTPLTGRWKRECVNAWTEGDDNALCVPPEAGEPPTYLVIRPDGRIFEEPGRELVPAEDRQNGVTYKLTPAGATTYTVTIRDPDGTVTSQQRLTLEGGKLKVIDPEAPPVKGQRPHDRYVRDSTTPQFPAA